jgi:ssDNA-binding Zn-finger/Zn-ribbon topoisomerase 1
MSATAQELAVGSIILYECPYCNHQWCPRISEPKYCPACHGRVTVPNAKKFKAVRLFAEE